MARISGWPKTSAAISCTSSRVTRRCGRSPRRCRAGRRRPARPCRGATSGSRSPRGRAPGRRAADPCRGRSSSSVMPCAATRESSIRTVDEHVVELAGQASDGDPDQAGVGVVGGEGEDRVGQAAALAHLLEEPAGGAATECGVEHAEGEPAVVVARQALHAEHQVDLLERPGRLDRPGIDVRRPARPRTGSAPAARRGRGSRCARRTASNRAHDGGVVEVAGHRRPRVGRAVVPLVEAHAPGCGSAPRSRLDRCRRSGARAGSRSPTPAPRTGCVRRRRVVVVHRDLVEDHVALGLDVLGGDHRAGDHVAQHVDRERQVTRRAPARGSRCTPWR